MKKPSRVFVRSSNAQNAGSPCNTQPRKPEKEDPTIPQHSDATDYEWLRRRKDPWWKPRLYYWIMRNLRGSEWKYRGRRFIGFFVRGWRGWASHDTWGLDHYLARVLAGSLTYLAHHHHGVPNDIYERHHEDVDAADAEWTQWLLDKAVAFDWYAKDEDGTSDELGWIAPDLSKEEIRRRIDAHQAKMERFQTEVLVDFVEHFSSLWD